MSGSATRREAIKAVSDYTIPDKDFTEPLGGLFGKNVFGPARPCASGCRSRSQLGARHHREGAPLDPSIADSVASAMRDWALENGASHYAHVFYPLTGLTAEKHDSFLEPDANGGCAGPVPPARRLIQGEPDGSSFPDGGIRSTLRGPRLHRLGRDQPGVHPARTRTGTPCASRRSSSPGPARRWTRRRRCCAPSRR